MQSKRKAAAGASSQVDRPSVPSRGRFRNRPELGIDLRAQFLRVKVRRGLEGRSSPWRRRSPPLPTSCSPVEPNYHDLGPAYLEQAERQKVARRLIRRLGELGFRVDLRDAA
jgi:hypothetical protein